LKDKDAEKGKEKEDIALRFELVSKSCNMHGL
jgi:hypothetical protein